MPKQLLSEQDIERLSELKKQWPKTKIFTESFEPYRPSERMLNMWKFYKWKYDRKLLHDE